MSFGGGGGGQLTAHTHDPAIPLDGGALATNATSFSLANQSLLVSDGVNIQELGIGSEGDNLTALGGALSWEAHVAGDVLSGNLVMANSTTIGDYTQPASATCSSAATTPATPTYETDFSSTTGWSANTTHLQIDTGNSELDWQCNTSSIDEYLNFDLTTVDNSLWVVRCKITFDNITLNGTAGQAAEFKLGIYSNGSPSGETPSGDAIFYTIGTGSGNIANGAVQVNGGARSSTEVADTPFSTSTATSTAFYCQLTRESTTSITYKVFTDAAYSVQLGATITQATTSGVTGLRYLTARIYTQTMTGTGTLASITDLEFYNAINDVNVASNPCSNAVDNNVATSWKSDTETNPNIYVDMSSSTTTSNLALYPNAGTTETEIKIQSSTDAIAWTDQRTITWSNLTEAAWNYIRFNLVSARYWRIYGSSGASADMQIDEINVLDAVSDNDVRNLHGHIPISSSDTSLNNAGV